MRTPFSTKSIPQSVRRRLDLAIAVSMERLLATHVDHALDLIELVGDQVPFDDALEIYNRLLRLPEDEARIIATRALAALGGDRGVAQRWPERMAEADAAAGQRAAKRGLIRNLQQRLRGRIHDDLRRWIELEAARTEVALLETHIHNSLHFVSILEEEMPFTEAVQLYLEALEVRDSIGEVVYYFALTRLNEKLLPDRTRRDRTGAGEAATRRVAADSARPASRPAPDPGASESPSEPDASGPQLRVVDADGG